MISLQIIDNTSFSKADVLNLIQNSFREHLEKGIHYSVLNYTLEDFERATKDAIVLIAFEDSELLGTLSLFLYNKKGKKWAYNDYWAVSNNARRRGIGSMLINEEIRICKVYGCEYMISNTSIKSKASINGHLKNGYKIIGYQGCAVYTYLFRMQFKHPSVYDNPLFVLLNRLFLGLKMVLIWNPNGYHRMWVKFLKKEL